MRLLQDSYADVLTLKWYEAVLCLLVAIVLYVRFDKLLRIAQTMGFYTSLSQINVMNSS
jgi:hypothetical protein